MPTTKMTMSPGIVNTTTRGATADPESPVAPVGVERVDTGGGLDGVADQRAWPAATRRRTSGSVVYSSPERVGSSGSWRAKPSKGSNCRACLRALRRNAPGVSS